MQSSSHEETSEEKPDEQEQPGTPDPNEQHIENNEETEEAEEVSEVSEGAEEGHNLSNIEQQVDADPEGEGEADGGEEQNDEAEDEATEKKSLFDSDDEEFAGFGEEELKVEKTAKKRSMLSDDSENEEANDKNDEATRKKKKKKDHKHHRHHHHHSSKSKKKARESGQEGEEVENDEVEQEQDDDEIESGQRADGDQEQQEVEGEEEGEQDEVDDDEETETINRSQSSNQKSDLDILFNKQKKKNRRKKGIDSEELNEMDGIITNVINEMRVIAEEDRKANEKNMPAIQKLKMFPTVVNLLQKSDYHAAMIDLGILGAIAEWLAPLPDRSLPSLQIRDVLIESLRDIGDIGPDYLKQSGIGKAVMYLYKHPKETKGNKLKLEKLIHNWSRPIFNLDGNFKQLSREERLQRDIDHVKSLNTRSASENASQSVDELLHGPDRHKSKKSKSSADNQNDSNKQLRPGDPGFCPRARVPIPSAKDYVIRPKSTVDSYDVEQSSSSKKVKRPESRLDKHKKRFVEIKRSSKTNRAVNLSVSGK